MNTVEFYQQKINNKFIDACKTGKLKAAKEILERGVRIQMRLTADVRYARNILSVQKSKPKEEQHKQLVDNLEVVLNVTKTH